MANLTKEIILQRARAIHGNRYEYDFSEYKNTHSYLIIKCIKHNYWFKQKAYHHLNGSKCPICSNGRKMTTEEFIIKAKEIHGNKYIYTNVVYNGKNEPVEIICPTHGSFLQKPHDHIGGCGCQRCKSWKTQIKIYDFLVKTFPDIDWQWEYSPDWLKPQRFDIYSAKYNLAIEYNGEQHYIPIERFGGTVELKNTIIRDNLKRDKCIQNNCKLYTIKYDDINYDKIKEDINDLIAK